MNASDTTSRCHLFLSLPLNPLLFFPLDPFFFLAFSALLGVLNSSRMLLCFSTGSFRSLFLLLLYYFLVLHSHA